MEQKNTHLSSNGIHFKASFNRFSTATILLSVALIFCSCEGMEVDPGLAAIDFDLVVADENMMKGTDFSVGTDIHLLLKATNKSNQEILMDDFNSCEVMNDPDFSVVYFKTDQVLIPMGRCLEDVEYFCTALYLPLKIAPNESIYLSGARWLNNPVNADLPKGDFISKYTLAYKGREFRIRAEFSIH